MANNGAVKEYDVTDTRTGKTYTITGYRTPTEAEIKDLIRSTLPKPSVEERVLANALYTGDDARRKAYLERLGKNPKEPGAFWSAPPGERMRELGTDIAEFTGPALKLATQASGETQGAALGALAGAPAGPAGVAGGSTLGFIAGGSAGRAGVQTAAELYAKARGLAPEDSRIGAEAVSGALTSGVGRGIAGFGKYAKSAFAKTPLGKKWEEFALTNLTHMPKPMQEWMERRGWLNVTNTARTPQEAFKELYHKAYGGLTKLFGAKDELGTAITQAKNELLFPPGNKPMMQGLKQQVSETVSKYRPNVTSTEANQMLQAAHILETYGGDFMEKQPTQAMIEAGLKAGSLLPENVAMITPREVYEAQYRKALDIVVRLGRKAKTSQSSALGNLSKEVNGLINGHVTDTSEYSALAKQLDSIGKALSEANLKDPVKRDAAIKSIQEGLFDEENIAGNKALEDLLNKYLGRETTDRIKDLTATHFARQLIMPASFGKLMLAPAVGSAVGGSIGYALGGKEGAWKGTKIGGTIGAAAAFPYGSPWLVTQMHRFGEQPLNKLAIDILTHTPKLAASPITSMIRDVSDRFGVQPTAEDLSVLKSRSKALSTP